MIQGGERRRAAAVSVRPEGLTVSAALSMGIENGTLWAGSHRGSVATGDEMTPFAYIATFGGQLSAT